MPSPQGFETAALRGMKILAAPACGHAIQSQKRRKPRLPLPVASKRESKAANQTSQQDFVA
jgi:hypothetical protein